jgi:hypothetical protein
MHCDVYCRAAAVWYASVGPGFQETRPGHGQENAPLRTAGMGAVTLTVHPVFLPAGPTAVAGSAPPGVMTDSFRQHGSCRREGRCGADGMARPASAPPSPAVIQVTVVGCRAAPNDWPGGRAVVHR